MKCECIKGILIHLVSVEVNLTSGNTLILIVRGLFLLSDSFLWNIFLLVDSEFSFLSFREVLVIAVACRQHRVCPRRWSDEGVVEDVECHRVCSLGLNPPLLVLRVLGAPRCGSQGGCAAPGLVLPPPPGRASPGPDLLPLRDSSSTPDPLDPSPLSPRTVSSSTDLTSRTVGVAYS